ncbi:DotH/IcmK family type IV secretion protein [Pseudomonas aeruginosa]
MLKSPLAMALVLAIYGGSALADESTGNEPAQESPAATTKVDQASQPATTEGGEPSVQRPPYYDQVTDFDKAQTAAKGSAIAGALWEESQLKDIRAMMREQDKVKIKADIVQKKLPYTPSEISDLKRQLLDAQEAQERSPYGPTDFRVRNITYNPDGDKPLVVQTIGGYAAQLEFYDSTGAPWPIAEDGVVGDKNSFSKNVIGANKHIASFVANRDFSESNAAVVLEGLPASIPVILRGTRSTVDGRITVTIPKVGPKAEIQPVFKNEIDNVSPELVGLQGGNPPAGSRTMRVDGVPKSEAYFDGKFMYLKLPGRLLLPPPLKSSMTPSGQFLYVVNPSPIISVSVDGERMTGTIEGVYQTQIKRARTVFDPEQQ